MPSRDELVQQLVNQWIARAQADLAAAEALAVHESGLWSIVAFHCQQSAEKFIKAALTARQIEFRKTHDILVLLDRLNGINTELTDALKPAEALTVYGVQARYP
jgi:HEPN domain-containing protein